MGTIKYFSISSTFFFLFLLSSCSSDNEENNKQSTLNPPSWTHGIWKDEVGLYTAKFTSNNLIFENDSGVTDIDFSKMENQSGITVTELVNTDSEYKIKCGVSIFHFRRKSENQIAFILADDPELPAEWILNKIDMNN